MECGFRPHDRDRTTESMEGGLDGLMGCGEEGLGCKERGVSGYTVNRWGFKQPPNGPKLDRRSTGGIPRPLGKPRAIPRKFNTRTQKQGLRGATARARGPGSERTTERTGRTRTDASF